VERLEKIVWVITGLIVVAVVVLAKLGPIKSELTQAMVDADSKDLNAPNDFINAARARNQGVKFSPSRSNFMQPAAPGAAPAAAAGAQPPAPGGPGRLLPKTGPGPAKIVVEPPPVAPNVPVAPGQPVAAPTVYIPASAREKYQHFDDIVELAQTGTGQAIEYQGQEAYQIGEIGEGSPLANQLGLQPGDILISVNGYPASASNSRQLYETLKNETHFELAIDRGGQRITIPYNIR
jgi:hypothetical protein